MKSMICLVAIGVAGAIWAWATPAYCTYCPKTLCYSNANCVLGCKTCLIQPNSPNGYCVRLE